MKRAGKAKKTGALLITCLLAAALSLQTAATSLAEGEKATLTIKANCEGRKLKGIEWSAYQVADMPEDGKFILTGDFASSGLKTESLNGSSQSAMEKSAIKIAAYTRNNNIDATKVVVTDSDGIAYMKDMERGLYLICQTGTPGTSLLVESTPFYVALPMMVDKKGTMYMEYNVTASPKIIYDEPATEPSTEPSTEPGTEPSTEPGTEPSTEPTTEPGSEPSTESGSEPTTEPETGSTEPGTDSSTEPGSESTTESGSEPPTGTGEATTEPAQPTSPGSNNNSGGSGGRDRDRGQTTTEIPDNEVPLASFLNPDPELITIEDDPVPLGAFPSLPKMGDVGTGVYGAGFILSLLMGGSALICRKKFTKEEE